MTFPAGAPLLLSAFLCFCQHLFIVLLNLEPAYSHPLSSYAFSHWRVLLTHRQHTNAILRLISSTMVYLNMTPLPRIYCAFSSLPFSIPF